MLEYAPENSPEAQAAQYYLSVRKKNNHNTFGNKAPGFIGSALVKCELSSAGMASQPTGILAKQKEDATMKVEQNL